MKSGAAWSILLLVVLIFPIVTSAQDSGNVKLLVRVYEDNDGINLTGRVTDGAYTNGTRLDVFYANKAKPRFLLDRLAPGFKGNTVYHSGWGLFQMMITPLSVGYPAYKPADYPYSGALIGIHTLYAHQPRQKAAFQTEWVLGVMGPASLARQTQNMIHDWFDFTRPRGWDYQYRTDLLLNYNLTYEKQLTNIAHSFELIGGAKLSAGTMLNAVSAHALIRTGAMTPYFNGFMHQYANKEHAQFYFTAKPSVQYVAYNSLLQGGLFAKDVEVTEQVREAAGNEERPAFGHVLVEAELGFVFSFRRFAVTVSQKFTSPEFEGLPAQDVGNISIYLGF